VTIRQRKNPTPAFNLPPPYNPVTGQYADLVAEGKFPYCAMMQIAEDDDEDDYVICRGFDTRIGKFYDSIAVAKPYGNRQAGVYTVGQMFPAVLPFTKIGQTPGVAATTEGHPADLDEVVGILYTTSGVVINWLLLDGGGTAVAHYELYDAHAPGGTSTAYVRPWSGSDYVTDTAADKIEVVDVLKQFRGRARSAVPAAEDDVAGVRGKHGSFGMATLRNSQWEIDAMQPHATWIRALVYDTDGFTGGATIAVDNVVVIQPVDTAILMADVTPANNIHLWDGDDNAKLTLAWNDQSESWDFVQMDCKE